jgi:phosphonate transport system ATP-binding protein
MAYLADGRIAGMDGAPAMTAAPAAVALEQVTLRYPGAAEPALRIERLLVPAGQRVAVIGPSGGGKTTLLRLLNGGLSPDSGRITLLGWEQKPGARRPRTERRRTGMVFQEFALVRRATVRQNVLAGRLGHARPWLSLLGHFSEADHVLAARVIAEVGLAEAIDRRVDRLSGGQRQRVAIARMLAQQPALILADEPVSHLDPALTEDMIRLLAEASDRRQATLVMVLHQPHLASTFADRVIGIRRGRLALDCPATALDDAAFEALYARAGGQENEDHAGLG